MIRVQTLATLGLGVALTAAGCSSDRGFRPWEGSDDGDGSDDPGRDPGGPGTGGWGDWDLGEVPDLALALATYTEDGLSGGTEVVITDLRGQILDRWSPPQDTQIGAHPQIYQVHPLRPGRVMVATHMGWKFDTQRGGPPHDFQMTGGWQGFVGPGSVWIGDLLSRRWERVLHTDYERGRLVVDGTGRDLPREIWEQGWNLRFAPYGDSSERLLLTWFDGACGPQRSQRVLAVPLRDDVEGRFWLLDEAWQSPDEPVLYQVEGGQGPEGHAMTASVVGPDPCLAYPEVEPASLLVRWDLDGREQILADDVHANDAIAFDARTGAALVVTQPTSDRGWGIRWLDAPDAIDLTVDHPGWVRPLAALDGDHGAAMLAMQDQDGTDDLVLIAGGRDVWTIEALKQGLGRRELMVIDGAVVPVPAE